MKRLTACKYWACALAILCLNFSTGLGQEADEQDTVNLALQCPCGYYNLIDTNNTETNVTSTLDDGMQYRFTQFHDL